MNETVVCDEKPTEAPDASDFVPVPARITMLIVVVVPFVGLLAGIAAFYAHGFDWAHLGVFLVMTVLTGLGITVGYHRLFTHRSFETLWPIKLALGILGSMAVEGPILKWVATHRLHHQRSDVAGDPHSPHLHGTGLLGVLRGFWHAHLGWMMGNDSPNLASYIGDLLPDRMLRTTSRLFPLWAVAGLVIPAVLGGALTASWSGVLVGFLWGGLARVFLVHHVTFSINSVCHIWGRRPFRTRDHSRNNFLFGILGMGEGWHNNHHAFPTSARHGLSWWEIDMSYLVIRMLETSRLAWNVRRPRPDLVASRLVG